MNDGIYSKEDSAKLTREFSVFSYGFASYFVGQLIVSVFELCSWDVWLHAVFAGLLIYWCVGVFKKLETTNKVFLCMLYGTLLTLIFLSYKAVSPFYD